MKHFPAYGRDRGVGRHPGILSADGPNGPARLPGTRVFCPCKRSCPALRTIVCAAFLVLVSCGGRAQGTQVFTNPILAGFYPDPSICRVGSDYYLVNSTFAYFPGIPVFHSRDLVNWTLIGHVLDRAEQLNLDKQGVSRGLFAPTIRFRNGVFYVTCTLVDIGGNFVVTAGSAEGPWSNPVWIPEAKGIDPSLFFDDDGKAYLLYNSNAPGGKPLYDGHRTIRMYEFDTGTLTVAGDEQILVNGGTDISTKPVWIEAPHIFKKDGIYYLIAAEGGTGDQHSEVVFRGLSVHGPYVPYGGNPILTQRQLDPARKASITSTGHADFVQTENGDWWAVFLGYRPYPPAERGWYNTGRETFLAPVNWTGVWPAITAGNAEIRYHYPYPVPRVPGAEVPYSGNFRLRDDFTGKTLDKNWVFLRTPHEKWYDLRSRYGYIGIKLRPETCAGDMNPSFLARRQQHQNCTATTAMEFFARTESEKAGIVVFQNETHYYFLCQSVSRGEPVVQLYKSAAQRVPAAPPELIGSRRLSKELRTKPLRLKIESHGTICAFSYASAGGAWQLLRDSVDATFLSTRVAGGFVGCFFALYATSEGEKSASIAYYDWFEYAGDDEVYR